MQRPDLQWLAALSLAAILLPARGGDAADGPDPDTLRSHGIVAGFGRSMAKPLAMLDRIRAIHRPTYRNAERGVYLENDLCIGMQTADGWRFAPNWILNSHEIVNHGPRDAFCYCPLAGLAIAMPDKLRVSGLLKYDTFVLYRDKDRRLILPFTQTVLETEQRSRLKPVQMLTYAGVVKHFPDAMILDPGRHSGDRNAYGDYANDTRLGVGHPNPGLPSVYSQKHYGLHPKTRVLFVGIDGTPQTAYPLSVLEEKLPKGGELKDVIGKTPVRIRYQPDFSWAEAYEPQGELLNLGYSFIFALVQHLPDLPIHR